MGLLARNEFRYTRGIDLADEPLQRRHILSGDAPARLLLQTGNNEALEPETSRAMMLSAEWTNGESLQTMVSLFSIDHRGRFDRPELSLDPDLGQDFGGLIHLSDGGAPFQARVDSLLRGHYPIAG